MSDNVFLSGGVFGPRKVQACEGCGALIDVTEPHICKHLQPSAPAASEARGAETEPTYTVRACRGHWHVECGEFDVGTEYDTQAQAREAADRLNAEPSSPTPAPAPGEAERAPTHAEWWRRTRNEPELYAAYNIGRQVEAERHGSYDPEDVRSVLAQYEAERADLRSQLAAATRERATIEAAFKRITDRLQEACQRHRLGLGGEHVEALVVEALDDALQRAEAAEQVCRAVAERITECPNNVRDAFRAALPPHPHAPGGRP